jgi:arylsulfatase A-like enzyme
MNAICLIVDRLNAGFLGPYGNSWTETVHFDRLAAQSFVFDQALIDSPDLRQLYRSLWHGWHAMRADQPPADRASLVRLLSERGVNTRFCTDTATAVAPELQTAFDEQIRCDAPPLDEPAESIDQTHLGRCFATLVDTLERIPEPYLLWVHLASLGTTWDAPLEYRERYRADDDPEPLTSTAVPSLALAPDHDPDVLLQIAHAYAGQVALLDQCVGGLLEYLEQARAPDPTLLVLMSPRGFPLGEHLLVGDEGTTIHGPLVQVPLMFRFPDGLGAAARSQALVEPADVWATLLDWWQVEPRPSSPTGRSLLPVVRGDADLLRDRLGVVGPGQQALRTPAWYFCRGERAELFAKPDDRWEVNNVAPRFPELADAFTAALAEYAQQLQADTPQWARLDDLLRNGM